MSLNPQIANAIAGGAGRVGTFIEQIQPGQGRMMPTVAGPVREGNTPANALPVIAGAAPVVPRTVLPTMPQAIAAGTQLMGQGHHLGCQGIGCMQKTLSGPFSSWPTWLKIAIPATILIGGTTLAIVLSRRHRRAASGYPELDF